METKTDKTMAEFMISVKVINAAKERAKAQQRLLTRVARSLLERAARDAIPTEDGVAHPAVRSATAERKRIRFSVDTEAHDIMREKIRASGISMTAALEYELARYARTGNFK